jgi:hypothetical protein
MPTSLNLKVAGNAADRAMPLRIRDAYLKGLPLKLGADPLDPEFDGVFVFNANSATSWASQAAPAEGDPVKNLAGGDDGAFQVSGSSAAPPSFDGETRAFDFTGVTAGGTGIITPEGFIAENFNSGNYQFLMPVVMKLPAAEDWPATKNAVCGFLTDEPLFVESRFAKLAFFTANDAPGTPAIWAIYQKATGADLVQIAGIDLEPFLGRWCVCGMARTAAQVILYLARVDGTAIKVVTSINVGTVNANDLSGFHMTFGVGANAVHQNYAHQIQFVAVENLEVTGRDPLWVLNDLRERIQAQGVLLD